jgi:cell division protein ZapA
MANPLVNEKLRVRIFGREYEMDPGGLTPLEANQLAAYVDAKMREISESLRIADTQKIAVLAAVNIAFELGQQQNEDTSIRGEDEKKIENMLKTLDKALK